MVGEVSSANVSQGVVSTQLARVQNESPNAAENTPTPTPLPAVEAAPAPPPESRGQNVDLLV